MNDAPFDSLNAAYVQALYEEYARNPESVPEAWRRFFARGAEAARRVGLLPPDALGEAAMGPGAPAAAPAPGAAPGGEEAASSLRLGARATALVLAFREHGHQLARLDPLGSEPPGHPQLDPSFFGTTLEQLEGIPAGVVEPRWGEEPLSRALERLRAAYCGTIAYEFEHLEDPERVAWLWEQVESGAHTRPLGAAEKRALLERLTAVEGLEHFLHRAYLGQKRFSIEGTDMLVPILDEAIRILADAGARQVVIGMAHRGRLNVLAHVVGVPYEEILRGFEGNPPRSHSLSIPAGGTGDVKYHLGAEGLLKLGDGRTVRVDLAPNPSHLEFVNPVVEGITRARQFTGPERDALQDLDAVVPILIHGDAAFAAEGIVAETLNLARLEGYRTGGTLHIIVDNQIGFTTDPRDGRSTRYSSDLAKGYDIPVIHVNADDPEACLAGIRLAVAYRRAFHDDVLVDLIGYRRHGHNEGDEPAYTQPLLYERVREHPTVRTIWAERLVAEGTVREEEVEEARRRVLEALREAQERAREDVEEDGGGEEEDGTSAPPRDPETGVPLERLVRLNDAAHRRPEGFTMHPKLARQLDRRTEGFGEETLLEWAHAELLAFASLLEDGIPVRLSGQDSERGTFSQRHLVLHDVQTGQVHVPLQEIGSARFEVHNSPLSEAGVLGFEYGYDVGSGPGLVLWEAQFGDFVNAAQVILDQFLAAGRAKWGQETRLTLLLPHGHEGQGPEHSSARLERFLQLCAEDNMRVAYPTTPAQYFHLLRRQALTPTTRPLVVLTPKSLLRHPRALSPVSALSKGRFHPVLDDPGTAGGREGVSRLILCAGKVYYDLQAHPEREERRHVAIARVEELYPFPAEELRALLAAYPALETIVWVQEEPRNMGALAYVGPRLRAVVPRHIALRHVSRPDRASPAEGKLQDHLAEQRRLVEEALTGR